MRNNNPKDGKLGDIQCSGPERWKNLAETAVEMICRGCCEYYRDRGGEAECGGYSAVLKGLESGLLTAAQLERIVDLGPGLPKRMAVLTGKLCDTCGYLRGGCDFQSPDPPEDATPCGGYRLIQALLERGEIRKDDLETLLRSSGV
jgi:hypothetical protein